MKKSHWGDKGVPGREKERSTVRVGDLMAQPVTTLTRHQTIRDAREQMSGLGMHSMPVVDAAGEPVGIVSTTDLIGGENESTKLGLVMTRDVMRVSPFAAPEVAARLMRKHHIHHLVVTSENRVVGILSSFDLLELLEDKRFAIRSRDASSRKGKSQA